MGWGVLNLGMLFGLVALAVPIIIHLLHRRRHDVIDWGAMQFLPTNATTRRRRFWDELPLMLLRMTLIALIVLALAGPYSASAVFAPLSERPPRDTVLVLDGSFSMGRRDPAGKTPWDAARAWAHEHITQMGCGERTAIIVARRPPLMLQEKLSGDRGALLAALDKAPAPRGNAGLPFAMAQALGLLHSQSNADERDIVVLTDRQHFGWADDASMREWSTVARQMRQLADRQTAGWPPRVRIVDVARERGHSITNYALGPLIAARGMPAVSQPVRFASTLRVDGPRRDSPAYHLRVAVDGKHAQDLSVPAVGDSGIAQLPIAFTQRFDQTGSHVVTLTVEPPKGPDALDADNEQHAVIEVVVELPVLLVDGVRQPAAEGSTFFIEKALTGTEGRSAVVPRVVPVADMTVGHQLPQRPRAVFLADVAELSAEQQVELTQYIKWGGGVLIALGPRARVEHYNEVLYRDGFGWLPARLLEIASDEAGARLEPTTFQHAALELFRSAKAGGLRQIAFPRWWKVRLDEQNGSTVLARFSNGDPWLVEKVFGKGRVILCTVPLDRSWDSSLPSAWEFPVLMHELTHYLAGVGAADWRLDAGQALQVEPSSSEKAAARLIVQTPEVASRTVRVDHWPWREDAGAIGLYQVEHEDRSRRFFVVPPDSRESEDRRCTDEEWNQVLKLFPVHAAAEETSDGGRQHELWWLVLLAVVVLLGVEVFLTRRLAVSARMV